MSEHRKGTPKRRRRPVSTELKVKFVLAFASLLTGIAALIRAQKHSTPRFRPIHRLRAPGVGAFRRTGVRSQAGQLAQGRLDCTSAVQIMYAHSMTQLKITHLRTHLREAIKQVQAGEDIEIVQNGVVVAALVRPERLRSRIVTPHTRAAQVMSSQMRQRRAALSEFGETPPPLSSLTPRQAASLLEEVKWHREHGDD